MNDLFLPQCLNRRVEPQVALRLPHSPGRADCPHPVLPCTASHHSCGYLRSLRCHGYVASMDHPCFPRATPFMGISLPYAQAFQNQDFPAFLPPSNGRLGTMKMLRLPSILRVRLCLSLARHYRVDACFRSHADRHRPACAWTLLAGRPSRRSFPGDVRISQVPREPLRQFRPRGFDSHLRPALGPRSNLPNSPSRWFGAVPRLSNAEDFGHVINFGARSHGSVLAVYASCRRRLRLRNTRFRLMANLCRSRFRIGMGSYDRFHLSSVDKLLLS